MAEDSFKTFKKRYDSGKITTTQMPPLPPGPGSVGKMIAQGAGQVAAPLVRKALEKGKEIIEAGSKPGQKKLMDKLEKARRAGAKARNTFRKDRGTLTDRVSSVTKKAKGSPRDGEKFGPLVKRQDNLPAAQGGRALVKREDRLPATRGSDSRALTVSRQGKGDLTVGRTFGDKGQGGRIVGLSNRGKLALGAGAVGVAAAGYKAAGTATGKTDREKVRDGGKYGPRDDRAPDTRRLTSPLNQSEATTKSSSSVGGTKSGPFKSDFAKKSLQGQQAHSSKNAPIKNPIGSTKVVKHSGGKASKPMTAFERQKMRGYEKEGYGGRSMTSSGAKARVQKERSYKFKDLFKKR